MIASSLTANSCRRTAPPRLPTSAKHTTCEVIMCLLQRLLIVNPFDRVDLLRHLIYTRRSRRRYVCHAHNPRDHMQTHLKNAVFPCVLIHDTYLLHNRCNVAYYKRLPLLSLRVAKQPSTLQSSHVSHSRRHFYVRQK